MPAALIRLGTSAFTAAGWTGSFYPENLKPADYLTHYATQFDTVEVGIAFYHMPSAAMVREAWVAGAARHGNDEKTAPEEAAGCTINGS
jgi:uncharacterized protein YecE (DUF72 family)